MGSRMGFEYRYYFSVDEEIISRHGSWYEQKGTRFVFEIRTNFVLKGTFDDDDGAKEKVIDSDTYDVSMYANDCDNIRHWVCSRFEDYWMSEGEIQEFVREAVAFVGQGAANIQDGMIPIAVHIDVCTVQREGESINDTMERAIRPEYLYPIYLCPWIEGLRPKSEDFDFGLSYLLRYQISKVRVEDLDKGFSLMEECSICLRNPTIGSQISWLQCGHAYHHHCIARWLAEDDSCPLCRRKAHDAFNGDYSYPLK